MPKRHKHKRTTETLFAIATQSKGKPNRRIISGAKIGNREYYLHSTKGYRSAKV